MMGFTKVANLRSKSASLYRQGEVTLILNKRRADVDSGPLRCISRHVPQRVGAPGCGKPAAGTRGEEVTALFDSQGPVGTILLVIITIKMPWGIGVGSVTHRGRT